MRDRKELFSSADKNKVPRARRLGVRLRHLYFIILISVFPLALTSFIWLEVWRGVASRAIDGSGHFAIAQIYDQSIFPDTFGWTNAYFAGMSFPNFYPPLFFWCVALIHHTHIVSFAIAFKLVAAVPLLLMPAAFWAITWVHSGKSYGLAFGAAIASMTLCTSGELFQPDTGLDISSTLLDGFYTQPLGFLLLLLWILVYLLPRQKSWQFALASILLALTLLANFFNAVTAILFIVSTLIFDITLWFRRPERTERRLARRTLRLHLLSPCVALVLAAFWLVPMLSSYEYLVTRPFIKPLSVLGTPALWCWYALAAVGTVIWWRRPSGRMGPYLATCVALLIGLVFSGTLAPRWFPLQVFRFFSTVNFLLSVTVGICISYVARWYLEKRNEGRSQTLANNTDLERTTKHPIAVLSATVIALALVAVVMSTKTLTTAFAFYTPDNFGRIGGVLHFGETHRDGRYLVEVLPSKTDGALVRADSLALNAYLGAQGNETISIVYREASPNASFFNAELNAFSAYKENFGISSALMDDVDFINQPLAQHLKRLQFIGVRYLVIATSEMKERLSREPEIGASHEIGAWTILELRQAPLLQIRSLQYRPALVVSDFTLKLRRQNQHDFVRLAEEQFSDAWFDVLLVRSPEKRIDRLRSLDQFGALILDTYGYEDEGRAFAQLKEFAQTRTLILLTSDAPLLARIESSIDDFPHAVVIQHQREELGAWVEATKPSHRYDSSSIRQEWKAIRTALDKEKITVAPTQIESERGRNAITLKPETMSHETNVPVVIATTYHPKWVRSDGDQLYATTPFFTLAFISEPTRLTFERNWYDRLALWASLATLLMLSLFAGMSSSSLLKKGNSSHEI